MESFRMDMPAVAAAGARIGGLSADVGAGAVAGAAGTGALVPVFGLVGGDYVAALMGTLGATDVEIGRLAAYYGSAGVAAVRTVAAVDTAEARGTAAVLGAAGTAALGAAGATT